MKKFISSFIVIVFLILSGIAFVKTNIQPVINMTPNEIFSLYSREPVEFVKNHKGRYFIIEGLVSNIVSPKDGFCVYNSVIYFYENEENYERNFDNEIKRFKGNHIICDMYRNVKRSYKRNDVVKVKVKFRDVKKDRYGFYYMTFTNGKLFVENQR